MIALDHKQKQWWMIILAVLCLPPLIAFNPFPLYFLNDDFIHIPLSQSAVFGQRNSIRPVGDLSLYFDGKLWGENAVGYHVTNIIIHLVNSILVYFLAKRILVQLTTKDLSLAAATAAVFFWGYAFHAESVFWIIGRSASIGAFFFLLVLMGLISKRKSWIKLVLLLVLFLLGLLSYESVAVIIPIYLLKLLTERKSSSLYHWLTFVGLAGVFIFYLFLRVQWTGEVIGSYERSVTAHQGFVGLDLNYFKLIARTLVGPSISTTQFIISVVVVFVFTIIAGLAAAVYKQFTRKWWIWIGCWLLSYLPYLSLGIDTHGVEAERYLYLPSIFACVLFVALLANLRFKKLAVVTFLFCWCYHQFYLFKEAKAYQVASSISRSTMNIILANQHKQHYYFSNLPNENYGVPIFRLGLVKGVEWLSGDTTASNKIRVVSFQNNPEQRFGSSISLENKQVKEQTISGYHIPALQGQDEYNRRSEQVLLTPHDLLIHFTDSAMFIYK